MKHLLFSILFLAMYFLGKAQSLQPDTVYLDQQMNPLPSRAGASYYSFTRFTGWPDPEAVEEVYYLSGIQKAEHPYSSLKKKTLHGLVRQWYENGQPQSLGYFEQGQQMGPVTAWYESGQLRSNFYEAIGNEGHHQNSTYYPDGQLKRRDVYFGRKLVEGRCFTSSGEDTAYYAFEVMPLFPGGDHAMMKFLATNIKYPKADYKKRIQGLVVVQYTVTAEGELIDFKTVKSLSPAMDEEALRVVRSMPRWIPGAQDGVRVPVRFTLPIRYSIR